MKRTALVAFLLAALTAQTGCGAAAAKAPAGPPPNSAAAAAGPAVASESAPVPAPVPAPVAQSPAPAAPAAPHAAGPASAPMTNVKTSDAKSAKTATGPSVRAPVIIYQGDLRMVSDEDAIPKTIDRIIDIAESVGGHLATRKDLSVQIKVPSASFRETLTKIDQIGGVVSRSVAADDVSEEFHDLEVRLANLRATRQRLQEFLARAGGIQDMLTVERELERVAQEIDRAEGRLEFLRTRAAMSIVTVNLSAKPKNVPVVASTQPAKAGTDLPIPWVRGVGIDPLLSLHK